MAKIPAPANRKFVTGLKLVSRGKVRDMYSPTENLLLAVTTDRISSYDFVLPVEIPFKGAVLNAVNIWWALVLQDVVHQDLYAYGRLIDNHLPLHLLGDLELQTRSTVVTRENMANVEAVFRGHLTGSAWKAYQDTAPNHMFCGQQLPPGLSEGAVLNPPLFTPTTKSPSGHDLALDVKEVDQRYPGLKELTLELYQRVRGIAARRGILMVDGKNEFGINPAGGYTLADERYTPDACRFWLEKDYIAAKKKGKMPPSLDKQFVRDYLRSIGITAETIDPEKEEDIRRVHGLEIPRHIIFRTSQIYRYIFWRLTGYILENFQRKEMHVDVAPFKPQVEIVIGSESDRPQIEKGLEVLTANKVNYKVHVISCHRNPERLEDYAQNHVPEGSTIIAGAGLAAALPGITSAWLRHFKKFNPVIGVAFSSHNLAADDAARLSIEQLPGQPVELDNTGRAYFGALGFEQACEATLTQQFVVLSGAPKPAQLQFITSPTYTS